MPEAGDLNEVTRWLVERSADITSVSDVRRQREAIKSRTEGVTAPTWLCLSLGERLLSKIQPDLVFGDEAFRRGIERRAGPVLGDRTPPKSWRLGGSNAPIDVLLIIASNSFDAASERTEALLRTALAAGLTQSYREMAERIDDLEHFGFRDGISQPKVAGSDPGGEMQPGHFVFGYPKHPGGRPTTALHDPNGLATNGSLMVARRLQQEVKLFRDFCEAEATRLKAEWPSLTGDHLQALLVGRWPKGSLVSTLHASDPGFSEDNMFDFTDDVDGLRCPFGAHIRKVNPRKGPRDTVEVPRILRRGIPFGPRYEIAPEAERGLLFVSFQTSISDSFEFLSAKWMNARDKPGPASGHDLLVGRSVSERSLTINSPSGPVPVNDGRKEWIRPTGGAYLFCPGRSALKRFEPRSAPSITTRATRAWLWLSDRVGK